MAKRYWWVIIAYFIMQYSNLIVVPPLLKWLPFENATIVVYYSIFAFIACLIAVLFLMKPDMKAGVDENATGAESTIMWIIVGVFMAFLGQGIAGAIELYVFNVETQSENTRFITEIAKLFPAFIIITTLIAPILEEIIFRKIIFGTLYKRTNFFVAAILSALAFGFIHGEPEHILVYSSMGLVFAFLYVKTKRILVPIAVHMLMNAIALYFNFNLPEDIQQKTQVILHLFGG
ncbi:lysostaphin resistance A-like protein [Virgibacillus soli]|uniref:CPBP family intramembrane glutamic endopeptidase n=1 Tax=Paracerasibacillus soli TaxID=480284 RepID=UPI0035E97D69